MLTLEKNDGYRLQPPLISLLENYSGKLWHAENGYPHPLSGLNIGWRQVVVSLEDFLDVYNEVLSRPFGETPDAEGKLEDTLLNRYKDFIYRAVEFVETAADKTKFSLVAPDQQKSKWGAPRVAGLRRHADIICNKLKHNQHRLIGVSAKHLHGRVEGYMVAHVSADDKLVPNKDIHKDREAFSFNVDVRKIMANLYLITHEIKKVADESFTAPTEAVGAVDTATEKMLMRLSALPILAFPGETAKHMPVFRYQEETLRIEDRGGEVRHSYSTHQFRTRYISDGLTRTYHVPFMASVKR